MERPQGPLCARLPGRGETSGGSAATRHRAPERHMIVSVGRTAESTMVTFTPAEDESILARSTCSTSQGKMDSSCLGNPFNVWARGSRHRVAIVLFEGVGLSPPDPEQQDAGAL